MKQEPINEHATPRKCSVCQQPASWWVYEHDAIGGINQSTRDPRCESHKDA